MTTPPAATIARWVEVHRLAVAGRQADIARATGGRVGGVWLSRSRFADVEALATATLTLGPDASATYQRGWARRATGQPRPALQDYQQALTLYRQAGDYGNEAATLNNIGGVHAGRGDRRRALDYYQQALPIRREVGDRAGEAITLNNIGGVRFASGDLVGAERMLGEVLEIVRLVGDQASEALVCFTMAVLLEQMRRVGEAVTMLHQAVRLAEQTGHPGLEQMRVLLAQLEQNMQEEGR